MGGAQNKGLLPTFPKDPLTSRTFCESRFSLQNVETLHDLDKT